MKNLLTLFIAVILSYSISAQSSSIWGITPFGGNGGGCIFRTNSSGENLNIQYAFPGTNNGSSGINADMIEGANGLLYGLTMNGGVNNEGIIYSYNPIANTFTKLADFNNTKSGMFPYGSLLLASNGKLYGVCLEGGEYNYGTIFEFDTLSGNMVKLHDFNGNNGKNPKASLMQASNGKIYGSARNGGTYDLGVIFEYDISSSTYVKKFDFQTTGLRIPLTRFVQAPNGKLVGIAAYGGSSTNNGGIYEYTIGASAIVEVNNFSHSIYKFNPMLLSINGNIYGALSYSSSTNRFFEYNTLTANYSEKYIFSVAFGYRPIGGLVEISSGLFSGVMQSGGSNNYGGIFTYNINTDVSTNVGHFIDSTTSIGVISGLAKSGNKYYGISTRAFSQNHPYGGAIYEVDLNNNSITRKIQLNKFPLGAQIYNGLQENKLGFLYGTTKFGNEKNMGCMFGYDTLTSTESTVYSIGNSSFLHGFTIGMKYARNGYLYGGLGYPEQIVEFRPTNNSLVSRVTFNNNSNQPGYNMTGPFILGNNNEMWGMTRNASTHSRGSIFVYPAGGYTANKKYAFEGGLKGWQPSGSLCYTSTGMLYGMTQSGGQNGFGVLFEYNPNTNIYTKKFDFDSINGSIPMCGMVEYSQGILYGTTSIGGSNNYGVLFKYEVSTSTLTKVIDFNGTNGRNPHGQLLLASNNKIYGLTIGGGANGSGVIFEFDPINNTLVKKSDFNDVTGHPGKNSYLTELGTNTGISEMANNNNFELYPNPTDGQIYIDLDINIELLNVEVFDTYGKLVFSKVFKNTRGVVLKLDVRKGVYFVRLSSEKNVLGQRKLIVQ